MKMRHRVLLILTVISVIAVGFSIYGSSVISNASAAVEQDLTPVMDFQDHGGVMIMNPSQRGTSLLMRTRDGVSMNIDTSDLPVGAYTIWWVIFNDPSQCSDGECGENDVFPIPGNEAAGLSPVWATGGIVGPDRKAHFSASLGLGIDGAPGDILWGPGLTDPMGAEIHLIVRYHGPTYWADPSMMAQQIMTVGGRCTPATFGTDEGGFECYEPQATIHMP